MISLMYDNDQVKKNLLSKNYNYIFIIKLPFIFYFIYGGYLFFVIKREKSNFDQMFGLYALLSIRSQIIEWI